MKMGKCAQFKFVQAILAQPLLSQELLSAVLAVWPPFSTVLKDSYRISFQLCLFGFFLAGCKIKSPHEVLKSACSSLWLYVVHTHVSVQVVLMTKCSGSSGFYICFVLSYACKAKHVRRKSPLNNAQPVFMKVIVCSSTVYGLIFFLFFPFPLVLHFPSRTACATCQLSFRQTSLGAVTP